MGRRKFQPVQLYRFPILMGGIVGGVFTFWYSFSNVFNERIKWGSKKFTDTPKITLKDDLRWGSVKSGDGPEVSSV